LIGVFSCRDFAEIAMAQFKGQWQDLWIIEANLDTPLPEPVKRAVVHAPGKVVIDASPIPR
jgi:hypothetical protein